MELPALTRDQVRQVDRIAIEEYEMPGVVLMENAGRGAAEIITTVCPNESAAILCGGGNNGGDGYVIARHLQLLGHDVTIGALVAPDQLKGDALVNATIAAKADIEIQPCQDVKDVNTLLGGADLIVDAMLGTGARGNPRGLIAETIQVANQHSATRFAVDIPTGLDCDSGEPGQPTFRADHTITFVARKKGFDQPESIQWTGQVHVTGIGVPRKLLRDFIAMIGRSNEGSGA